MNTITFLSTLKRDVQKQLDYTSTVVAQLSDAALNNKPGPARWSILECYEHLNCYSRYYNMAVANAIEKTTTDKHVAEVRYSWLGKKFVAMMSPDNVKKQKTLKHLNPTGSALTKDVITEFIQHQETLTRLMDLSLKCDVNKKVIPVEFFKLLKISLADSLKFVVVHQQRHFIQLDGLVPNASHPTRASSSLVV